MASADSLAIDLSDNSVDGFWKTIHTMQWCSGKFSFVGTLAWYYRYRGEENGGGGGVGSARLNVVLTMIKIHLQIRGGGVIYEIKHPAYVAV